MRSQIVIKNRFHLCILQVKIWFQNRRSKYKKLMKAAQAQAPGGSTQPPSQQQENSNETMSPQAPDSFPSQPGDLSPPPNANNPSQVSQSVIFTTNEKI